MDIFGFPELPGTTILPLILSPEGIPEGINTGDDSEAALPHPYAIKAKQIIYINILKYLIFSPSYY